QEVKRPEPVDDDKLYRLLGVKWYAQGAFVREEKRGAEIKAGKLFRVESGDLIYNRLFAWKGSFALLGSSFSGCYVSGEFPVFRPKAHVDYADDELLRYLYYAFSSPTFWTAVERLSTGSTTTSRLRLN